MATKTKTTKTKKAAKKPAKKTRPNYDYKLIFIDPKTGEETTKVIKVKTKADEELNKMKTADKKALEKYDKDCREAATKRRETKKANKRVVKSKRKKLPSFPSQPKLFKARCEKFKVNG